MPSPYTKILKDGLLGENPIYRQVLGICSALAVTNLLANTLFMCFGVIFATALTNFTVSLLRNHIPKRIRMIVQVVIIASYVMMIDILIKAVAPDIHRFIGPYVGLIITNCIIMGRAEAFASQNKPLPSLVDGLACGLGYSAVLISIAVVREIMGFGTLLGFALPARDLWWTQWTIMVMPPGAFFMLAIMTWFARAKLVKQEAK
ncbi:MAG: electron transport complex subunit RsxE [Kiritimatiellae bacterium]|jgi:Na+-transporting NADH:ubiquinone oxidoreductase subunit D|nr:electron transport complex subunit RsxE [Kiritimatiellia bacterium]MDD3440167.1 electron transport complex subunit RsxE [Kiritimatiellia bacterium]MDD4118328.1 electron transport complex subunit RsxE [Kiritimatiellia bacterium]